MKMNTYEYKVISYNNLITPRDVYDTEYNKFLNKMGKEGWELCAVDHSSNFLYAYYFKRLVDIIEV